jgi:DNA-binding transcriptional ArsR family regulator
MDREELTALRDAIDTLLTWPDSVREQMARWLAREAAKPGNGLDHDPPPMASASRLTPAARPTKGTAGERKLLAAMEASPGASANALAKAAGLSRSTTAERLRRLSANGAIEKDGDGRWRAVEEPQPRPTQPSPATS